MDRDEIVTRMCDLFRGRLDAYGTDEGGCDKVDVNGTWAGTPTDEYRRRMSLHLSGAAPFGTYPLVASHRTDGVDPKSWVGPGESEYVVRWGCADLDYNDPTDALNLQTLGRVAGLDPWVEKTRSGHWHVWFFASEWVPAATMRNALLALYQKLDIRAKEVNPKQVTLGARQLGNYVRLPYPGWLQEWRNKQCMVDENQRAVMLDDFLSVVEQRSVSDYEQVASRYVPPPPPRKVDWRTAPIPRHLVVRGSDQRLVDHILRNGPGREIEDRSDWLAYVAHVCREGNLTPQEAYAIVVECDQRWTQKFNARPDGERRIQELVERVYG